MTEEAPAGSINVEDDSPTPEPVQLPPAESPEPVALTEDLIQQAAADPKTSGLLSALKAERAEKKALQERANKADEYEQALRQNQPYVDFLRANPNLMAPKAEPVAPPPPGADPDALEMAQLLDLYDGNAGLDAKKGERVLALLERRASKVTAEAVRPFQEQTIHERSQQNYQMALQIKDANGQTPTPEALQSVWRTLGPELTADPQVAATMAMLAHGATAMTRKQAQAPLSAPVISEASGGRSQDTPRLSAIEERIAQQRGITAQTWAENTRGFQRGQPTVLED